MVASSAAVAYSLIGTASLIALTQYLTATALPEVEKIVLTTRTDQLDKTYTMSMITTQSTYTAGQDVLKDLYINKPIPDTLPVTPYKAGRFSISFNSAENPTRIAVGYGSTCSVLFPLQNKEPLLLRGTVGEKGRCIIAPK